MTIDPMPDDVTQLTFNRTCYLFIQNASEPLSPQNVVYGCRTEERAKTLCQLFNEEYGGNLQVHFAFQKGESLSELERLQVEAAFEDLRLYTDPDRFIYEPPATQFDIDRAQYMFRADRLSTLLSEPIDSSSSNPASTSAVTESSDEIEAQVAILLRAVEKHRLTFLYFARTYRRNPADWDEIWHGMKSPIDDFSIPSEKIDSGGEFLFEYQWHFERVAQAAHSKYGTGDGSLPKSIGSSGESIEIEGGSLPYWKLDEDGCIHMEESVNTLIEGCRALIRLDRSRRLSKIVDMVRAIMHDNNQKKWYSSNLVKWSYLTSLDEAIHFIKTFELTGSWDHGERNDESQSPRVTAGSTSPSEEKSLDEQRVARFRKELEEWLANPGSLETAPEDSLNTSLHLLFMFAQVYYKLLESATSYDCYALDLSLNQSYLTTVKTLSSMLKNSEELNDFPEPFEPIFPDLYPANITDCDWPDYVQPHAEGFLSTVQRYVHDKGIFVPPPESNTEMVIAFFKPQVDSALKNASDYATRMRAHMKRLFPPPRTVPVNATAPSEKQSEAASSDTPLSNRAQEVLEAMAGLGALNSDSRKTAAEIAPVACGGDANSLKAVFSELRRGGFVQTKEGRNGGCWLTEVGLDRAKKLKSQSL